MSAQIIRFPTSQTRSQLEQEKFLEHVRADPNGSFAKYSDDSVRTIYENCAKRIAELREQRIVDQELAELVRLLAIRGKTDEATARSAVLRTVRDMESDGKL